MELQDIMKRLNASRSAEEAAIKTASVKTGNGHNQTPETLRNALRDALASVESNTKTASVAPQPERPTDALLKMASDMANAEDAALQKQATVYGAAMCDGFMARFAEYEDAAMKTAGMPMQQKTAAYDPDLEMIKTAAQDPEFQKFASENPELVKEAFDLGYRQQWDTMVKEAQDQFQQGYNDQMEQLHKVAMQCYKNGAVMINNILRKAA